MKAANHIRPVHELAVTLVLVVLGIGSQTTSAAEQFEHFRVQLVVTASESIKSEVVSYVTRELRSLHDVDIVTDNPNYILDIEAYDLKRGFSAVSTVVLNKIDVSSMVTSRYQKLAKTLSFYQYPKHYLSTGYDLRKMCETIVADFDANNLQEDRDIRQKLLDLTKQKSKVKK